MAFSQPANNNCNSATILTVGANNTQNIVTGTNVGATNSGQLPTPACGSYQGNDIWYTAQTTASGFITVETQNAGSNIDTAIEIYSGTCNALTQLACNDDINFPNNLNSRIALTGIPNTTIYIRVWAFNNATAGNFNIVAFDSTPPQNNNCANATSLVVGNTNTQNVVTGTNVGATDSGELPIPNCALYQGNDVWYTAQVPASGILTVETQNAGSNIDTGLAVYTGSCGALTQIACDDDSGSGLFSTINITGLPNTLVHLRVWAYNNASSGNFNIVAFAPLCPFTTRWNGTNWNNGIPNAFTSAILRRNYDTAANGSFEACNCTINANRTVNISPNSFITVHNNLIVRGILEVRHQGSLVMTNDNGTVTGAGTVNVYKTSTPLNNFRDFTYWSSPVNTTIAQAFTGVDPSRIFQWDIPTNTFEGNWSVASGTMTPARGYISEAPNTTPNGGTHQVTFTGKPNNGIINIPVGFNNDTFTYTDFNLIGNPYASAINIDTFIQASNNSIMDGTIWLWTHNTAISNGTTGEFLGSDYATYNLTGGTITALPAPTGGSVPSGKIASGQGFFIRTTNAGNVTFNNSMRISGQNTQFFRAPNAKSKTTQEKDRIWLNVESSSGGAFSQILIGFFDNATDGYDRGYEGERLGASWIDFYSKIDTLRYAVQGLNSFTEDKKVAIGFDTYIEDPLTYKISIYDVEGALENSAIYLVDHLLNITHDLKLADYEFDVQGEGEFPDRFTLQFTNTTLGLNDLTLNNDLIIINQEHALQLKASSIITNLKIYDLTGRLLINSTPNNTDFTIDIQNIKKGTVLAVSALFEDNSSIAKKVIVY